MARQEVTRISIPEHSGILELMLDLLDGQSANIHMAQHESAPEVVDQVVIIGYTSDRYGNIFIDGLLADEDGFALEPPEPWTCPLDTIREIEL